jgi:hypothetical protein
MRMVRGLVLSDRTVFVCAECGLGYSDEVTALECENWCSTHSSCNLIIARKAVYKPS